MDVKNRFTRRNERADFMKMKHQRWSSYVNELRELQRIQRDAPLVELDEPYQRGFIRYYALNEEACRREDIIQLREALIYAQHEQVCRRGDFLVKKRKHKGLRPRGHELRRYSLQRLLWAKVPEALLPYYCFYSGRPLETYLEVNEMLRSGSRQVVFFRYSDLCKRIIEPHMITHQRAVLPEVDARIDELDAIFERNQIWAWRHGNYRRWDKLYDRVKEKALARDDRRHVHEAVDDFYSMEYTDTQTTKGADDSAPLRVMVVVVLLSRKKEPDIKIVFLVVFEKYDI